MCRNARAAEEGGQSKMSCIISEISTRSCIAAVRRNARAGAVKNKSLQHSCQHIVNVNVQKCHETQQLNPLPEYMVARLKHKFQNIFRLNQFQSEFNKALRAQVRKHIHLLLLRFLSAILYKPNAIEWLAFPKRWDIGT